MNHSGDAAEQIVRMSLEGAEVAARITGGAAKEIALLLFAALKSPDKGGSLKHRGKARMASMLKSGKALEIYSVKESDLKKFYQGAKQYGIVYCVLRNSKSAPDGLCDILVKAEDAPKISRVAERFKFATVDKAKIESEIVAAKAEREAGTEAETTDINDTEKLLDDLLGADEPQITQKQAEAGKEPVPDSRPLAVEPPMRSSPSEHISGSKNSFARDTFDANENSIPRDIRPSVKEELRQIKAARNEAAQRAKEADTPAFDSKAASDKPKTNHTTHAQPQGSGKPKFKKAKERA